ncbi:MAG: type II CAAX endopeptidase family protein [Robiginitomaculum sp.]
MANISALTTYFEQTNTGNSRWWTWLCGFWFAVTFFIYAQIIIMLVMGIAITLTGQSDLLNTVFTSQDQQSINSSLLLIGLLPLFPILFWMLRGEFKSPAVKKILIGISALIMIVTTAIFIYTMSKQTGNNAELTSALIAAGPMFYGFILATFPPLIIGFWLVQKFIHSRTFLSLLTAAKKFRWKRLFFTMGVFWIISGILAYLGHVTGLSPTEYVFNPNKFWGYAFVTLLFIPLQSATEEIALRGYLNQGLGHFIKYPLIVFFITSAAFAALHLSNPEVTEGGKDTHVLIAISGYFIFGMFACLLTWLDGGLESAIGMHAANNMFAATIVGYENSALPTPTVFRTGQNASYDSLFVLVMLALLFAVLYFTRQPIEQADNEYNIFDLDAEK